MTKQGGYTTALFYKQHYAKGMGQMLFPCQNQDTQDFQDDQDKTFFLD